MRAPLVLCVLVVGCSPELPSPSVESGSSSVVAGRAEPGYPAAGYLMMSQKGAKLSGPWCGATLIAPDVAVTAAHCIHREPSTTTFGFGAGDVYSSAGHPARRAIEHPLYDPNAPARYRHDIALLLLSAPVPGVTPATVAATQPGATLRYVGYGRTTAGDYNREDGYGGDRKSARQSVTYTDSYNVWTNGTDGGLCWGDSGGPLMLDGKNELAGVLADFYGVFNCYSGNAMIFTSLAAESDFLTQGLACAASPDPACTVTIPTCTYTCKAYGYAPNQCHQGWRCTNGCLAYQGAC
jgi:trypsin